MSITIYHMATTAMVIFLFSGCIPFNSNPSIPNEVPSNGIIRHQADTRPDTGVEPSANSTYRNEIEPGIADLAEDESVNQAKPEAVSLPSQPNHYYYFLAAQLLGKSGNLDHAIQHLRQSLARDPESSYLKRELALVHLQQKDTDSALHIVERQLNETPDDIEALILYGRIKQSLRQIREAMGAYEKVISQDPTKEDVYLLLGGLHMENEARENALRVYSKLVENFPLSYVGHFFLGKIHADSGDMTAAEKEFLRTLELEPELEEPQFELLKIYESRGKTDRVISVYYQILARNPKNLRAAMELGYVFYQNEALEKADEIFADLGRQSLSNPHVVRKAVQRYLDTKRFDAAIVIFEGMLKSAPDSSDLHYVTGIAYDGKKDYGMTLRHLQMVMPDSRFYKSAVLHSSFLLQKQGEKKEAIRNLLTAIKSSPPDPEFLLHLGNIHEDSGDYEAAVSAFRRGLEIAPRDVNLRFRLGAVYDQWGLKESSIEEMKVVIQIDPEHANALNYLGYTYADLGENLDEAERLIRDALRHEPESGAFTDSLGWVYFKKGLFDEALKALEKAVTLVPEDPIILEHLGDAYQKVNNRTKALEFYNRSLLELEDRKKEKALLEEKIRELTEDGS